MAKLHDKETQSIAASVSDVLEGKKSVKEVDEPKSPSGKNGPQTGEKDFKKKHVVKKSGMKADGSNIKEKKLKAGKGKTTIDVDYVGDRKVTTDAQKKHKVKIKAKGRGMADISGDKQAIVNMMMDPDIMGMDAEDLEDLYPELFEDIKEEDLEEASIQEMDPKKHVKKDEKSGMYCVYNNKGSKVKEFKSKEDAEKYAADNHDDLMKEVKAEESDKQKKYQAFFQNALKKFGVKSPQELDKEKRKEFFNYVDKNYDAGEGESD